jgi:hypothetical protein
MIRTGQPAGEPAAYGAALRTGAAARARIEAFAGRRGAPPHHAG